MTVVLKHILNSVTNAMSEFFSSDMDVMSNSAKKIMADRRNREIYLNGIKELREAEDSGNSNPKIVIILKDGEKLTLSR